MTIPTGLRYSGRRNPAGALTAFLVAALTLFIVAACGGSSSPAGPGSTGVDTTTLAGTWKGTIEGRGPNGTLTGSVITLSLNADSTYSGEGENPAYCRVTGSWTVSNNQFKSTGRDCSGVIVTSLAPFDKRRLTGTWSGSSGGSGTFTVAKQ